MHDIISDILDWDEVQRVWTVAETGVNTERTRVLFLYSGSVNLTELARAQGVHPQTAYCRPGMILARTFNVAQYFDGYVRRIAAAGEQASVHRAALARAAVLDALGEPES